MVSLVQLQSELAQGHEGKTLGAILRKADHENLRADAFPHVHPDHPLDVALRRMAQSGINVLPVVSRSNVRQLLGVISLSDILRAYGVGEHQSKASQPAPGITRSSKRFLPGLIATTLAALVLVGFLNHYYTSRRTARAEGSFKAGNELSLHGQEQAAVEQYRNALSISPENRQYRLALGLTLVKTNHPDEAAVYLQELLRRDPNNGSANLGLARAAAQQGKAEDAITYYHRAIYGSWPAGQEADPMNARFELAGFLEEKGLRTQAVAELLAALDRARNDDTARKRIARLLLNYGSLRQSAEVFRDVLRRNDRDAEAYAGLGSAELAQESYASARTAFRSALRLNPDDAVSGNGLALCDRVLELDPTVRGLDSAERFRRSQTLLKGSLDDFQHCFSSLPQPEGTESARSVADAARKALADRPSQQSHMKASETDLSLAVELRAARQKLCPAVTVTDEARDRVLARISR